MLANHAVAGKISGAFQFVRRKVGTFDNGCRPCHGVPLFLMGGKTFEGARLLSLTRYHRLSQRRALPSRRSKPAFVSRPWGNSRSGAIPPWSGCRLVTKRFENRFGADGFSESIVRPGANLHTCILLISLQNLSANGPITWPSRMVCSDRWRANERRIKPCANSRERRAHRAFQGYVPRVGVRASPRALACRAR